MKQLPENANCYTMETLCIETGPFSITGGQFARMLMSWHLRKMWWAYACPVTLCAGASFADIRFLLVALMMVFIMAPMALFFVYINYGFDAVNRYNVLHKRLIANANDGIRLIIDDEYGLKNPVIDFAWNEVERRRTDAGCMVLVLRAVRYRFIAIPLDTFANEKQLRAFIGMVDAANALPGRNN